MSCDETASKEIIKTVSGHSWKIHTVKEGNMTCTQNNGH